MDGNVETNATHGNPGNDEPEEAARRSLIRALYADDPERAPDWLDANLLSTGEVALLFRVSRRTVTSWAQAKKLPYVAMPGGQRRFRAGDVRALLDAASAPEKRTISVDASGPTKAASRR